MRKRWIFFFSLLVIAAKVPSSFNYTRDFEKIAAQTTDSKSPLYYPILRKRFLADDKKLTTDELLAMQIGHTRLPTYKPYADIEVERGLYELNAKGYTSAALELANSYQRRNPLSLMLNLEKAYSLHKQRQADSAAVYLGRYERLIETMLASGDGDQNPYFVLSPIDGQILITRFWQGELGVMGSGFDKNKNMLDILEMKENPEKKGRTYSFHIQHASSTILK